MGIYLNGLGDGAGVVGFVNEDPPNNFNWFTNGICFGFWCYAYSWSTNVNERVGILSIFDGGFTGARWCFYDVNSTQIVMAQNNGTEVAFGITGGGGSPAGSWFYVICRFINDTNRRATLIAPDGTITHNQDTTSNTVAGLAAANNVVFLDASGAPGNQANYIVAEFWLSKTDIVPGGGAMSNEMAWQLARHGPFSMPGAMWPDRYQSLRVPPVLQCRRQGYGVNGEFGLGVGGAQGWTFSGVYPTIHPPLATPYIMPSKATRIYQV